MSQADKAALRARDLLIAAFVVLVGMDALLVAIAGDVWAIGRILFTLIIMVFVLHGVCAARTALGQVPSGC